MKIFEALLETEKDRIVALDAEVAEIKNAMDEIQNKYPQIGTKYAVWGVSDGIPLAKKFMSDEDFAIWTELGKKRDEARRALHKAKMSLPRTPSTTSNSWGDNRGYGQGRYMGDSIEEDATVGAISASSIATVPNPKAAHSKPKKRGKYGAPEAPQKKNADGTAKNALNLSNNLMGGKTIKR
jgi:hypothetical protein